MTAKTPYLLKMTPAELRREILTVVCPRCGQTTRLLFDPAAPGPRPLPEGWDWVQVEGGRMAKHITCPMTN